MQMGDMGRLDGKKPTFRVLLGGAESDPIPKCVELLLDVTCSGTHDLRFHHFHTESELQSLVREGAADLICLYAANVDWQEQRWFELHLRAREVLSEINRRHSTTIVVLSAWEESNAILAGTGITVLLCPFLVEDLQKAIAPALPAAIH